jgi:hypothetical protein
MELFLVLIAVASVATNLVIAKTFFDRSVPVVPEVIEAECRCSCRTTESPEPVVAPEPEPVPAPVNDNEKYQAWRNVKEQPATTAPTPPIVPAPKPGPLERPAGFYR